MKPKQIKLLVFILLMAFIISGPANALMTPYYVISDDQITSGESFEVGIYIHDTTYVDESDPGFGDLTGFGFQVLTTNILFDAWAVEPGFDDPRGFGTTVPPNRVEAINSPILPNAGENMLLATLFFEAGATGSGNITIPEIWNGTYLGLFFENASETLSLSIDIKIREFNPIPEPGTIMLMGIGLLGFARFSRKKE